MRSRSAAAVVILALTLAVASPASAAPIEMSRDRDDGALTFDWDADTGTFSPSISSVLIRKRDPVIFYADAKRSAHVEDADRLVGRLTLTLNRRRAVHYSGTFTFKVNSVDEVIRVKQSAAFTLRARPGKRKKVLRFPFDLGNSGSYTSAGRFVASP